MKRPLLAFLAALLGAFAIACGGGGSSAPTATPPSATSAPITTGEPVPTVEPAFQSFAYEVQFVATITSPTAGALTSIERRAQGFFVAPSSHAFSGGLGIPGQTPGHAGAVIGDRAWYREGQGDWQEMSTAEFLQLGASALTSAQQGFLNDPAFEGKLDGLDFTAEQSGDVAAHKYVVAPAEVGRIGGLLRYAFLQDISQLRNLDLTVWTSEETGALVRAELSTDAPPAAVLGQVPATMPADATARITLHVQLSQINDTSIKISPPN